MEVRHINDRTGSNASYFKFQSQTVACSSSSECSLGHAQLSCGTAVWQQQDHRRMSWRGSKHTATVPTTSLSRTHPSVPIAHFCCSPLRASLAFVSCLRAFFPAFLRACVPACCYCVTSLAHTHVIVCSSVDARFRLYRHLLALLLMPCPLPRPWKLSKPRSVRLYWGKDGGTILRFCGGGGGGENSHDAPNDAERRRPYGVDWTCPRF